MKKQALRYKVISQLFCCEEVSYRGYGIMYGEHVIPDISTDPALVERLAELFNELDPEPCRLTDIIETFLP